MQEGAGTCCAGRDEGCVGVFLVLGFRPPVSGFDGPKELTMLMSSPYDVTVWSCLGIEALCRRERRSSSSAGVVPHVRRAKLD